MSEQWCMTCGYKRGKFENGRSTCPHGHGILTNAHLVVDDAPDIPEGKRELLDQWILDANALEEEAKGEK